jgi:CRP-like cAMP-binding protein
MLNTAQLRAVPQDDRGNSDLRQDGLNDHFSRIRDHSVRLRFPRNDTIAAAGEAAAHIYAIQSGCIRLCHHGRDGRRHIADFLFAGDTWGLGDAENFALSAEAVSAATVTAYPRPIFDRLGEGNNRLRADIMAHLCEAIARAHRQLFLLNRLTARERMATFLVRMMQKSQLVYGARLDLPMGRRDIADHLGLTIETVCRALSGLKDDAVIEIPNAHLVVVRNYAALRAIAATS